MKAEIIAQRIRTEIQKRSRGRDSFVIGIDGYAGSGKTTVANLIGAHSKNVLIVHLDDFIEHWEKRKEMIDIAEDKAGVFEYQWYRYVDVCRLIRSFIAKKKESVALKVYDYNKNEFGPKKDFDLSKKILVINGIFLFHPEHHLNELFDMKIYLDVDFAKADKRRIAREKKLWGKDYIPENHPDNWTRYFKQAYRRYVKQYRPKENADLVFKV